MQNIWRRKRASHFGIVCILCFLLCIICSLCMIPAQPAFAKETTADAPATPTIVSFESNADRQATATWETVEKADGYDLRYANSEGAATVTVTPGTVKAKTLKLLKGGSKYKCRVRSFRMDPKTGEKVCSEWSSAKSVKVRHSRWSDLQEKYTPKKKVNHLIFVKYLGNSRAKLIVYRKAGAGWKKVLSCKAYTGSNGLNKKVEGDRRTPTGTFTVTRAFGVKKDPGSRIRYTKLKKSHYWCADRHCYNRMISIKKHPHKCSGEHLIKYRKQYAYALAFNYNKKNEYGKGSAIFLHCFGYHPYTMGCIAISKDNMKKILRTCEEHTKICIYPK